MASSYTSPLTVVRDVETSILDGTDGTRVSVHGGKAEKMEKRVGARKGQNSQGY